MVSTFVYADGNHYQVLSHPYGTYEVINKSTKTFAFFQGEGADQLHDELDAAVRVAEQGGNHVIPNQNAAVDHVCDRYSETLSPPQEKPDHTLYDLPQSDILKQFVAEIGEELHEQFGFLDEVSKDKVPVAAETRHVPGFIPQQQGGWTRDVFGANLYLCEDSSSAFENLPSYARIAIENCFDSSRELAAEDYLQDHSEIRDQLEAAGIDVSAFFATKNVNTTGGRNGYISLVNAMYQIGIDTEDLDLAVSEATLSNDDLTRFRTRVLYNRDYQEKGYEKALIFFIEINTEAPYYRSHSELKQNLGTDKIGTPHEFTVYEVELGLDEVTPENLDRIKEEALEAMGYAPQATSPTP